MFLIDHLHQRGIGVILDWVPSHFPADEHGLAYFDGTHLYEHADPRQGYHPDWNTSIFNYGRNEVRSFLLSSADLLARAYHVDGLRVDAVASMLYLDYSRKDGEWIPNEHGGRENLEAIAFLRRLNEDVVPGTSRHADHRRGVDGVADGVAADRRRRARLRLQVGHGLDARHAAVPAPRPDPPPLPPRRAHVPAGVRVHRELRAAALARRGRPRQGLAARQDARRRRGSSSPTCGCSSATMWAQPGKKLLFMGGELGQPSEWDHDASLDWHLREDPRHGGILRWVRDLNALYPPSPRCTSSTPSRGGFEWIDASDADGGTLCFLRRGQSEHDMVVVALNLTPMPHERFRIGLPDGGAWHEALNSDAEVYGGSGMGNLGSVEAEPSPWHGRPHSAQIVLPPLSCLFFRPGIDRPGRVRAS